MKKLLIIISLLFFTSTGVFAQDGYVFTKEQHAKIKKNLEDYRLLITRFDSLSNAFDNLTKQYKLIVSLRNGDQYEMRQLKLEFENKNQELENEKNRYTFLQYQNDLLKKDVNRLEKELKISNRQTIIFKAKYAHERKWTAGERIAINIMWGIVAAYGVYDLVDLIRNNHPM